MSQRLAQINNSVTKNRLQQIRNKSTLDTEEIKDLLYHPGCYNKYIKPLFQWIDAHPHIFSHYYMQGVSLVEQRKEAAKMAVEFLKAVKVDLQQDPVTLLHLKYVMSAFDHSVNTKVSVHYMLYVHALLLFGNSQLHRKYYLKAISTEDLGCFGLTEFHHGSFSKGIETKAYYDHASRSFTLTTEGTKGMKFWIGGAAELMTMSVIWAQLIVNGKSEGPHPFVVPIRSKTTHQVLPGITIGDCGSKNGVNGIDNAYLIFDDVKVPFQNLLGKYGTLDVEGNYKSPVADKDKRFGLHMSGFGKGRAYIAYRVNNLALNAITIALRYSFTRKQFQNPKNNDEIIIIDYPITKMRIIPNFACVMLQIAAGQSLSRAYLENSQQLKANQSLLAELHAISTTVKSSFTSNATRFIYECRTILGGHGYSAYSGMDKLFHSGDINTTWEGDNNILLQQTSKYLMNTISKKSKTSVVNLNFVHEKTILNHENMPENLRNLQVIEALMQDLFRIKYNNAKIKTQELKQTLQNQAEKDNFHSEAGNSLALGFADHYTFQIAKKKNLSAKNVEVRKFIQNCLFLWAFTKLENQRYGSHDFRKTLQKQILALSQELVDASILVTDALSPSKAIIGSPFADKDGEGFKEYLNIIYSKPNSFNRAPYFNDIKAARSTIATKI